ncbi:hypothetical protein AURDEDRAFT_188430 [Auricularia subglabra TFB-10046 SS5]|uniref:Arrestin-like N-terminal domain-containing protein n=1 Tax=Auricularia subglabra (strain TFB-10046 / SS5) TaxID=717982 RepID=J0D941_AURST|nr:hypothetical protein AURDEDRAFT_188430 [Auricularia subglabra TFB-10046 SS5]
MFTGLLGGRRPTIKIQPYQDIFHLHPPSAHERSHAPVTDGEEIFWGTVALSLPSSREFDSLLVKLVGHYTLALPGHPTEIGVFGEWETNIPIPRRLDKGEHSFAWSLRIPRSSAPYERCLFGKIDYKLVAVADGPAGAIKTDRQLEVIAVPVLEAETSSLNERIEGSHQETGPYLITLESQHLTVGGLIHFSLNFPSVPAGLRLHSITADVVQSYALHSQKRPGQTRSPPSHHRLLFNLDSRSLLWDETTKDDAPENAVPRRPTTILKTYPTSDPRNQGLMASLSAGGSLRISHVARLPDDYALRATTLEGTQTPIRISHTIVLDIKFSGPGADMRLLRTERPLTLLSCGCLPDSVILPPYVDLPGRDEGEFEKRLKDGAKGTGTDDYYVCVCLYAFDTLIQPLLGAHKAHAVLSAKTDDILAANKRS